MLVPNKRVLQILVNYIRKPYQASPVEREKKHKLYKKKYRLKLKLYSLFIKSLLLLALLLRDLLLFESLSFIIFIIISIDISFTYNIV